VIPGSNQLILRPRFFTIAIQSRRHSACILPYISMSESQCNPHAFPTPSLSLSLSLSLSETHTHMQRSRDAAPETSDDSSIPNAASRGKESTAGFTRGNSITAAMDSRCQLQTCNRSKKHLGDQGKVPPTSTICLSNLMITSTHTIENLSKKFKCNECKNQNPPPIWRRVTQWKTCEEILQTWGKKSS